MKNYLKFFLAPFCLFFVTLSASAQDSTALSISIDTVPLVSLDTTYFCLKEKQVSLIKHSYGNSKNKFIVIHDSENTGLEAALDFIRTNGGQLLELQYGGDVRNVSFYYNSKKYEFDPNGIFTEPGIVRILKKFSLGPVTPGVVKYVRNLGLGLLKEYKIDRSETIITLHNNTDKKFSILDYMPGKALAKTASRLHVNPEMDPDDLLLVTELHYFNYLKERNLNVIYQSPKGPNDGSLSVYAQLNKIPYVNIEIQHGHFEEQRRLIEVVTGMIQNFEKSYTSSVSK